VHVDSRFFLFLPICFWSVRSQESFLLIQSDETGKFKPQNSNVQE